MLAGRDVLAGVIDETFVGLLCIVGCEFNVRSACREFVGEAGKVLSSRGLQELAQR